MNQLTWGVAVFGPKESEAKDDPRSMPERWVVAKGKYDGRILVTRFNHGVAGLAGRTDFNIHVGVAIPLKSPDSFGLPAKEESAQLSDIEDKLVTVAGSNAVLVGVITTSGMREFVLYTPAAEWIEGFHKELQRLVTHHEVQVIAKGDPSWEIYKSFVKPN